MRPVHEAMGKDLVVVRVGRSRHPEVRDARVCREGRDQLWGPIGRHDLRVVIHLLFEQFSVACIPKCTYVCMNAYSMYP